MGGRLVCDTPMDKPNISPDFDYGLLKYVKQMQRYLGLTEDGLFGAKSFEALKDFFIEENNKK